MIFFRGGGELKTDPDAKQLPPDTETHVNPVETTQYLSVHTYPKLTIQPKISKTTKLETASLRFLYYCSELPFCLLTLLLK